MKVLFLDIDGVLNNDKTFEEVHDYYVKTGYHKVEIGLDMVERLFKIIEATGAKIVLSSSWRLGWNLIEDGNCVPVNQTEAVNWYRKAAERGDRDAQYKLGGCYEKGFGVQKDLNEAMNWYERAAEKENKDALTALQILQDLQAS